MKVLFIGGTGNISTACSRLALSRGIDLVLLNRGKSTVAGARSVVADHQDEAAVARALGGERFDVVVNFIAYDVADVERDLRLFGGRTGQYLFISTAAAYRKPAPLPVSETQPLDNPGSPYATRKIACERRLEKAPFPVTVVRPSLTYDSFIPLPLASGTSWTLTARMLRGQLIPVAGDGCVPWTVTHSDDFAVGLVGLLGNPAALGQAFHITGDEVLTWDQIHRLVGAAVGVEPNLVHVGSEDLAAFFPDRAASILADKMHAMIFDNARLKAAVPDFAQRIPFTEGIKRTVAWFQADPSRLVTDPRVDHQIDRLLAAHAAFRGSAKDI